VVSGDAALTQDLLDKGMPLEGNAAITGIVTL
jgi:hypothetical protein